MTYLIFFYLLVLFRVHSVDSFRFYGRIPRLVMPRALLVEYDGGRRTYPINIGHNLLNLSSRSKMSSLERLNNKTKVLVVTDDVVGPLHLHDVVTRLNSAFPMIEIESLTLPTGEQFKTMESALKICDTALDFGLDRQSAFIALGGGVITDLVGFAASIHLRGVDFIQFPTSLVAMVDSSLGGKTGVNRLKGKNLLGTFHNPIGVVIDIDYLKTLPDRMFISGIAEIIKTSLVYDAEFFEYLESHMSLLVSRDTKVLTTCIQEACRIKAAIVCKDEKDKGIRATLNLGHTFGHVIELNMGYGRWLHGEAVSVGIVMAFDLSLRHGWVDKELVKRVIEILKEAKLPTMIPYPMNTTEFIQDMKLDKKTENGQIRLVLPRGSLGNCECIALVDTAKLIQTLNKHMTPHTTHVNMI